MCYLIVGKLNVTWSAAGFYIMLRGHGLIMHLQLGFENGSFFCGSYLLKFSAFQMSMFVTV
jgi:hypothetical protein